MKNLLIPQGFSPNGDGINDFFEIIGLENLSPIILTIPLFIQLIERNIKDESWFSVIEREISQISVAVIVARQNFASKLDGIMANPKNSFFPAVRILWIGKLRNG